MRSVFIFVLISILGLNLPAQEFFCNVQVSSRQVEGTDKRVFETLQNSVYDFLNNRKWSDYEFQLEERIEATILITVTQRISTDEFSANLNVVLRRPVFNSSYNSILLNYIDEDFRFKYVEYEPLDFYETSFSSNLTSVLAFYLYFFMGLDFDSFIKDGGTPYFEKAEAIVNLAQSEPYAGWKSFEGTRNRYWLVENNLNASYQRIRDFMYEYHRLGLDNMYDRPDQGRDAILKALEKLQQVNRERPGLFMLQLIIDAKRSELINVFSEGSPTEKTKAVNILKDIDPANSEKYQEILDK